MYRTFYSLTKTPFNKEVATKDLFPSENFSETMARLTYLKDTRGIGVLTGEPGAGKTSALRHFVNNLNPSLFKPIYFPMSTGTVLDFYRGLTMELGEEPSFRKVDLFKQIQRVIYSSFYEKKITPVLILDEMQMSSNKFLTDISILFNFSMDSENPFVLILSGLPFLMDRLSLNQNQPLAQRIVMRYKMAPLKKEEVKSYIEHHLKIAGATHEIFTPHAIEAIASRSRGWPRIINNLATNALLLGYQFKANIINEEIIFKACEETGL
jgi:type II secretory pathway predicted ATPase ExeA